MIAPHGGKLVNQILTGDGLADAVSRARTLPKLTVTDVLAGDIQNIARGVFSPMTGFVGRDDFESIVACDHTVDGTIWTIPIVLDVPEKDSVTAGQELALCRAGEDDAMALLTVDEVYEWDKDSATKAFFGSNDERHPGVAGMYARGDYLVGGDIHLLDDNRGPFAEVNFSPAETRQVFAEKGWETVVAFQTRNVPHIGHEFLQKAVLGFTDGLFIQPIIGKKKPGDFRDEVIIAAYHTLIENYYTQEHVFLNILPTEMRYGGPKEAILHAIMRKNYGCTGIIIGRDHAGVSDPDGKPYYGEEDAIHIFRSFPDIEIQPFSIAGDFGYCTKCNSVSSNRMCDHQDQYISFSGTEIRQAIQNKTEIAEQVMRPEVLQTIMQFDEVFVR
jgi:sulfate adenylyltransferase